MALCGVPANAVGPANTPRPRRADFPIFGFVKKLVTVCLCAAMVQIVNP
jgi:hypothetical protein